MGKLDGIRAQVKAIEAQGFKFLETASTKEAKADPRRDGSYRHPFVDLASVDERHISVRLERPGGARVEGSGVVTTEFKRTSKLDKAIVAMLEGGPQTWSVIMGALVGKDRSYVQKRIRILVDRKIIVRRGRGVYALRGTKDNRLFDSGACYVEALHAVPERGIFKGDMLELSSSELVEGDLVMASKVVPMHLRTRGARGVVKDGKIGKVIKVWPKFVVIEGGEIQMRIDVFKVTSVFRGLVPGQDAQDAQEQVPMKGAV